MIHIKVKKTLLGKKLPFVLDIDYNLKTACTVLFGASGSGKTLTLNCIAGLTTPDSGLIRIEDTILFDSAKRINIPTRNRHIGLMFQDYALFPHLTVLQNISYSQTGFFARHVPAKIKTQTLQLLEKFQMLSLADRLPAELSGGQRQRIALLRTLNTNPKILLLDEPFSALDPLLRLSLRAELANLLSELKIPSIIITHDPEDVDVFASDLILYHRGHAKHIANFRQICSNFPCASSCLIFLQEKLQQEKLTV